MPRHIPPITRVAIPGRAHTSADALSGFRAGVDRMRAYVHGCLTGEPASVHRRQREIQRIMGQLSDRQARLRKDLVVETGPSKRKRILTALKVIDLQLEKGTQRLQELERD